MNLYFDCTSGVSSDMILKALIGLGGKADEADKLKLPGHSQDSAQHDHGHHHSHRSHREIISLIENSDLSFGIKKTVLAIYEVIAKGEAQVHGTTVLDVHFHEVGRDQAIRNITGIAAALESLGVSRIYCSPIHDGTGFIQCSHGRIPVPVPAVMAMRQTCDYVFVTDDIETELVTPSGLGILMGIGAKYAEEMPPGKIVKTAAAKGGRDTGKEGLKAFLIQGEEK
ncbi:MAG: nickel insertion protein [Clostridiales Family XIII bacterium]|nr:LarC family nickel insertion protein [Anaerovorax odorimutans]MCI7301861.1 LarC family nickel insertion protein [Clostridia bacterium]MDE8732093.1 DUF111 family protein [Eubacteriales bacterium DFI.9.88]MDY3010828.1 nickel insertion protein [Clostridiales Family XIII bacterium]